jgi:hypothetical protein
MGRFIPGKYRPRDSSSNNKYFGIHIGREGIDIVTCRCGDNTAGFCDRAYTATAIPFIYSFSGNCAASAPNFHIHVSVSDLYIPRIGPHISSSRKGRPIVGIYNSLTDTCMWKLGLRPRYSFAGNICFKFSAFCLCSVRC